MKDALGNKVKTGDILIELGRGGGYSKGERFYSLRIWQMPASKDGSGFTYDIDGKRRKYWWTIVKNSIKINLDKMPVDFKYSFYHGMCDINTTIEYGTLKELINNSDWKNNKVNKKEVERFELLKKIKIITIKDIINNIDELKKEGYLPNKLVSDVLKVAKIGNVSVKNGEIGIAAMQDVLNYKNIIDMIAKSQTTIKKYYGKQKRF